MVMDQHLRGLYGSVSGFKLNDKILSVLSGQNLDSGLKKEKTFVNQNHVNIPPLLHDTTPTNSVLSSSASQEGDLREDFGFSHVVLKYVSEMLMEEDVGEKTCMFQESSPALEAAEKSLYELIGEGEEAEVKHEVEYTPDESKGKKNPIIDDLNLELKMSDMQSAVYTEPTVSPEDSDDIMLNCGSYSALLIGKEERLQEDNDDIELAKEGKVEEDRAGICEGVKEMDIDNATHSIESVVASTNQLEKIEELDNGLRVETPNSPAAETVISSAENFTGGDANLEVETEANVSTGKRKRGRPAKTNATPLPQRNKKEEEDVCFICFDGGSLVLCDRRCCPKAYHPACIKRDEAFFRSRSKWDCGWHICTKCQKASHYMCYTCPYSLCKRCTKDSDYVCVRGNKGFCGVCMKTIMLIENIAPGNTDMVEVDFDDKTSWEYLFKYYWIDLKVKFSLTVDELTKAKSPWKGDELSKAKSSTRWVRSSTFAANKASASLGELYHVDVEKAPFLNHVANAEANHSKIKENEDQAKIVEKQISIVKEGSVLVEVAPLAEATTDVAKEVAPLAEAATKVAKEVAPFDEATTGVAKVVAPFDEATTGVAKELLEIVALMKNGDTSAVSESDVQPHRESEKLVGHEH